jgi:large subunit ribosomal protein L28
MSRVCEITGKHPHSGNSVSHANNKTRRKFLPNLKTKRFFIPEDGTWITLKVSTKAIKTINNKGISAVLKEAREKGILAKKKTRTKPSNIKLEVKDVLGSGK